MRKGSEDGHIMTYSQLPGLVDAFEAHHGILQSPAVRQLFRTKAEEATLPCLKQSITLGPLQQVYYLPLGSIENFAMLQDTKMRADPLANTFL